MIMDQQAILRLFKTLQVHINIQTHTKHFKHKGIISDNVMIMGQYN